MEDVAAGRWKIARVAACALAAFSLNLAAPYLAAQALEPSPYARDLASRTEPLPLEDLIDASLVLSGAGGEALAGARSRLEALVRDVREVASSETDPQVRGNAALVFLHERVLKAYVEEQTRVDVALQNGRFNCVSSAVLYMLLARAVDLPVVGVRTRDHAFCAVLVNGALIDVETTNVYGFDPGERHEFQDQFGRVTGFSYVPANRDSSRVETDERGLLSLIPQNLASLATQQRQFGSALGPAADGYALARDEESRRKLLITVSNMASWLAAGNRFDEALSLLDRAASQYGGEARMAKLREDLVHNEVAALLQRGEIERATRLADNRRADGELADPAWRDLMVSATQLRAQTVAKDRGFLEAFRLVQEAIDRLGNDVRLIESERVYRHNFEVEAHNAMASAYNAGRLEEARGIVERALERLPDSARLRSDLATVTRALEKR